MKAIDRFYEYLAEKKLKPTTIEKEIGLSNGYLSIQKKRGADMGEGMMIKIIDYFRDINPLWLLTGEGSMFREALIQQTIGSQITSISPDAIALRLMDKLDEKESKIEQLQSALREKSEELAVLNAKLTVLNDNCIEDLGNAKNASTKKHSSHSTQNVGSVDAQLDNL